MSNKRFIIFFLLGSLLMCLMLAGLSYRAKLVASAETHSVLCSLDPEKIDGVEVAFRDGLKYALRKDESGSWHIVSPFTAQTDSASIFRFLDAVTQTQLGDMLSDREIGAIGRHLSDFGLNPAKLSVTLHADNKVCNVRFGTGTPSHGEIYARVNELKNVFAVSAKIMNSIPVTPDGFRRHAILSCYPDEVASLEFRTPGMPFLKLVNEGAGWQFVQPFNSPADVDAVDKLVSRLSKAKAVSFEWPTAETNLQNVVSQQNGEGVKIPIDRLAGFGIDKDTGLSITIRTISGDVEQIVFGDVAGTNLVYALVQNGTAIVTVDAEMASLCKNGSTAFRDLRIFPVGDSESVKSLSLTVGQLVYVLTQDAKHVWQLDAPVVAPADQAAAIHLVEKVLSLKQSDVYSGSSDNVVNVSVNTSMTNYPNVKVAGEYFGKVESFADLRSKVLLQLDIASIKRLALKSADREATVVAYNPERNTWNLEKSRWGSAAQINQDAVKKLLTALVRIDAVSVETVAASLDDINRCGLNNPSFTIAIDMESNDAVRKNILIGRVAPGGGRYATVGGMDAVFILSRSVVSSLTAPITE